MVDPHTYFIPFKEVVGKIQATGGIQQGSKDAPLFWNLTMYLIRHDLLAQYDQAWILDHLVVYADDFHMRWIVQSPADGLRAMHDLSFLMRVFSAYGLKINPHKSFALLRLVGKALPSFQKRWISRMANGPMLRVPDMAISVPLVAKTSYLGVIISYRAWEADTTKRRLTAAQTCFRILRRWLLDKHHPIQTRIKLYRQCVLPTVLYGVFEMGLTHHGCCSIIGMVNKHFRSIAHAPVHLTRIPTQDFFHSLGLSPPWHMLQTHFDRLVHSLSHRRSHLRASAMSTMPSDAGVHVPDYPETHIPIPSTHSDPCTQVPVLKCHECHRAFTQAGPYKRHLREHHWIPCIQEDLYNPLRDTTNGHPICRHCNKKFTDFFRLRDHINKRVCLFFNALQDQIVPICNGPDLRMHLRYKSIPGLLLNKALMKELSNHCAYCHSAIAARSIRRHYRDCHAQLLTFEPLHRDQVYGLANLGSGKGICILCDQTCNNVRTHQCGVLLQLSIMLGQTCDVNHFPVMPIMMRGDLDDRMEDEDDQPPRLPQAVEAPMATDSGTVDHPDHHAPLSSQSSSKSPSCLHKCPQCHMAFLTQTGLDQHIHQEHAAGSSHDRIRPDLRKHGRQKTIQQMLQAPYQEPPHPPLKQYECPLCQETVGRKALWVHLKREHQATKQDAFEFVPERDMLPGSLTCRHCFSSFTMEQALVTHFKRSSCPVLTCEWARKLHFGSQTESSQSADVHLEQSLLALLHRYFDHHIPGLIGSVQMVSTLDLVNCWFPLLYMPISCPQQHLQWFDHTVQWLAHFPELPQTRFVTDQVFQQVHELRDQSPVCWAWTLDCELSPDVQFDRMYIHDSFGDQLHLVKDVLLCIAQILARP